MEKRYIEANALKAHAIALNNPHELGEKVVTVSDIEDAPTADVVEVVRCKDCVKRRTPNCQMYWESDDHEEQYSWESDDDFCSAGERATAQEGSREMNVRPMERLTTKIHGGTDAFGMPLVTSYDLDLQTAQGRIKTRCTLGRLEDILYAPDGTPRISLERLKELVDADAGGRITIGKSVEEIEYDKFLDNIEYIACTYCPIRIFCSENSGCVHTCRDMAKLYYKSRVSAEAAEGEQE